MVKHAFWRFGKPHDPHCHCYSLRTVMTIDSRRLQEGLLSSSLGFHNCLALPGGTRQIFVSIAELPMRKKLCGVRHIPILVGGRHGVTRWLVFAKCAVFPRAHRVTL